MSKEFEGGEIMEICMNVIIIPKQNVDFSDPPQPKTKEAKIKMQEEMTAFIHKEGFKMVMNDPEQRCLLVEDGLGIGIFKSLEEIYDYVKKECPAADIERYRNSLVAKGYPADFHKLPPEVWNKWDELPEEAKQAIREKGADILEMVKIETDEDGKRVIHPNPKFKSKPDERKKSKEEQRREVKKCVKYIYKSGFQVGRFDDGGVGILIDANSVIGPFLSLEDTVRYLEEGYHLIDITTVKEMDEPTVH